MNDDDKSKQQLIAELNVLRGQVAELQAAFPQAQPVKPASPPGWDPQAVKQKPHDLSDRQLAMLYAGATIASSLTLSEVLDVFTREMVNLLEMQASIISMWDEATDEVLIIARHGVETEWAHRRVGARYPSSEIPLLKWVLTTRHAQYITINQIEITPANLASLQANRIKTWMVLPMEFQNQIIGLAEVIEVERERTFTAEDIALTQFLANQAATAMENARLYAQSQQEVADRRQAEDQLRQISTRNQAILDAIPDTLFFLDREGNVLDYKVVDGDMLLPLQAEVDLLGQDNLSYALQTPPDMIDQVRAVINKVLDQRITQVLEYQRPSLFGVQEYETRFVASGKDEVLAIVRDITGRKQTERQLIRTERLAALGHLAAALAHETNNPLQAIQSNLDLMLKYPLEAGEREEYLQVIRRQIDRMTEITRQVLNFARPHTSSRQLVCMTDLVEEMLALAGKKLEQSRLKVVLDAPAYLPLVSASPQELIHVFLNLVLNTIEAMTDEQGHLNVTIYHEDNEVVVSFTSDGPAISPEILPHIFEPFFTTKLDGNGLGLWISHSIVDQHQGSLTAENLTNKRGVLFTVRVPVATPVK